MSKIKSKKEKSKKSENRKKSREKSKNIGGRTRNNNPATRTTLTLHEQLKQRERLERRERRIQRARLAQERRELAQIEQHMVVIFERAGSNRINTVEIVQ